MVAKTGAWCWYGSVLKMALMPVCLDDQAVGLEAPNLGAVPSSARQQLEPDGRIVVEVQLDGQAINGDEIEQGHDATIGDREVRLYLADPRSLATSTLGQVRDQLVQVRAVQAEAAELLQQDEAPQALKKIFQCIKVWRQAQQAVFDTARLLQVNLSQLMIDGAPITDFTTELIENLKVLMELITNRDTVGLADALAYEWSSVVDRWDRLIEVIEEEQEPTG